MIGQSEAAAGQFEIMPFGAGGSQHEVQLEEERGGRRAGAGGRSGGGRAGGRPPPKPPGRPFGKPPRPRYPRSVPWPGYAVPVWPWARWDEPPAAPYAPAPYPAPEEEPFDDGTEGEVSQAERAVLQRFPPKLRDVLLALPDTQRPRYEPWGTLPQAANKPALRRPGVYMIVFTTDRGRQAYNGQADNVRRRLQQHLLSVKMLGLENAVRNHEVFVARAPGTDTPRTAEKRINERMLKPHPGVLTNQRHEFEAELMGEAWL